MPFFDCQPMIFESNTNNAVSSHKRYGIGQPFEDNCLFEPYKTKENVDTDENLDDNYKAPYDKMPDLTQFTAMNYPQMQ